ncbi:MAG: restriction endonuclease [Candidatus Komeilibacteria bacterium]|nr:restriction endonuclease [Candidatus Komeilibacteria bacterium]
MLITKASGQKVQFDKNRYRQSLQRVGLNVTEAKQVCNQVYQDLEPETSTTTIHNRTYQILKKKSKFFAARYSLKRAMMNLGPSGYFFERYLAAVLAAYNYKTSWHQFLQGHCVEHEVDVVAERDNKKILIECKYHNQPGGTSDLKIVLYIYARFLDLKDTHHFDEVMLATNTHCTTEAIKYARCMGLKILGWRYPETGGLEHFIEEKKLYPITVLTDLSPLLNQLFREKNLVLVKDLLKYSPVQLSKIFGLKTTFAENLIKQAKELTQ